ncbi:MAG TPA: alpha/beta hydrolase [Opitutus sp.]|nr:alpha/beta hydrolase [Opitutus sp.]
MKLLTPLLVLAALVSSAPAMPPAADQVIPLWPEGVPNFKTGVGPEKDDNGWVTHIATPVLAVRHGAVDRPTGTAVVICPGGGYAGLAREREGVQYADWLATLGVTSFILNNRVGDYGHPAPLQDVLRAIRIVRSRAAEFHVDPDRIGVMGSSAGGHLAASAATLFADPAGKTGAALDAVSARPDFAILMYPVITFEPPYAHAGSRENLIGKHPSPELVAHYSLDQQVTPQTPPTLLIHTEDDTVVPVQNSILFYEALIKAHVPADLYIFAHGPHGMAMRPNLGTASNWPTFAADWLRVQGFLDAPKPKN